MTQGLSQGTEAVAGAWRRSRAFWRKRKTLVLDQIFTFFCTKLLKKYAMWRPSARHSPPPHHPPTPAPPTPGARYRVSPSGGRLQGAAPARRPTLRGLATGCLTGGDGLFASLGVAGWVWIRRKNEVLQMCCTVYAHFQASLSAAEHTIRI